MNRDELATKIDFLTMRVGKTEDQLLLLAKRVLVIAEKVNDLEDLNENIKWKKRLYNLWKL